MPVLHKKTVFLTIVLLLVISLHAFAEETVAIATPKHIIADYVFKVDGKSKIFMLERFIVPPNGDPPFDSLEKMDGALKQKQTKLFNMRVFEKIDYSYEIIEATDTEIRYKVTFHVDDAFTFLPIPYPKYDSNFGFRIGLKMWDKNLFGLFGDFYGVIHATQIDSSWSDWKWYSEMELKNLTLGSSTINLDGTFKGEQHDGEFTPNSYEMGIDWKNIKLVGSTLSLNGRVDTTFSGGIPSLFDYEGRFTWSGIPVFGTTLNLSGFYSAERRGEVESGVDYLASMNWKLLTLGKMTTSFLASYDEAHTLTTSLRFAGIPIGTSRLTLEPVVVQKVEEEIWDFTDVKLLTTYEPLKINGEPYRLNLNFIKPLATPKFQVTSRLTLLGQKVFDWPISLWLTTDNTYNYETDELVENGYGVGISSSKALPFSSRYAFSYGVSFLQNSTDHLNETFVYSTTQALSFGEVNWKNNFRKGIKGSVNINAKYADIEDQEDLYQNLTYGVSGDISTFLLFGRRFGISSRINGSYAHLPTWAWTDLDSDKRHFPQYLPDELLSTTSQIRGILNDTIDDAIGEGDYRKIGAVMNLDATLMFIKFDGFAEGFMSAFMDIGVFSHSSSTANDLSWNDVKVFKTIGVEGYGILDKFRSYPIRGSLGVNLDHLIEHLAGDRGFADIEYELMIGMGLHY